MNFCPDCSRAMARNTQSGVVVFVCYCGFFLEGSPENARIAGGLYTGDIEEMYRRLIRNAAHDRVNQRVKKDCPLCGIDYLVQIRVGNREIVIWVCKCGYDSSRKPDRPAPPPAD